VTLTTPGRAAAAAHHLALAAVSTQGFLRLLPALEAVAARLLPALEAVAARLLPALEAAARQLPALEAAARQLPERAAAAALVLREDGEGAQHAVRE